MQHIAWVFRMVEHSVIDACMQYYVVCSTFPVQAIVEETRDLPDTLAENGRVAISRKQTARLIGQVFLQRSAVNLLGVVLDVPEFFWSAPDHLQVMHGLKGDKGRPDWDLVVSL